MISDRILKELRQLAPRLLFGSVSTSYRTCGQPSCRCHQGERHGPYFQVTYREDGRTRAYYVPQDKHETVQQGVRAWARFQELARRLADENRDALGLSPRKRRPRRSTR